MGEKWNVIVIFFWMNPWRFSILVIVYHACWVTHMLQYPTCITLEECRPLTHAHQWTRTTANVRLRFMTLVFMWIIWDKDNLLRNSDLFFFFWVSSISIIKQLTSSFWGIYCFSFLSKKCQNFSIFWNAIMQSLPYPN